MQSLQARVDSFRKTKRVKRYPNKSSSAAASVKWPHPQSFKATADTLAEAGFYFSPSWDDRDTVACFLCRKELSEWDKDDDPFEIHYSKCRGSCAWALVRCGLTEDLDDDGRFVFSNRARLPSNKDMEKARLKTFGEDWWPHDGEPGHGATSVKMAQAGFVYTPHGAGDDTVTCLYCNLSLSGWEKQDDPTQEHRNRGSKSGSVCPFFESSSKPPTISSKSTASSKSTTSSKPRRKTRATRGKSTKSSTRRSPSPSRPDIPEAVEAIPDAPTEVSAPEIDPITEPIVNDPIPSLPDGPLSPPDPAIPSKLGTPLLDATLDHPDPVITLSPAGQPTIANSELLTNHERMLSLEQWIRQEISLSYERLLSDGQRQIDLFKIKAAELRKCIDEL